MHKERLRIENITLIDQNIKTLNHFSLNLYIGEVLGVFINSGLEKKHFIDLIQGKVEIERGRICFENRPINIGDQINPVTQKMVTIQSRSKLIDDLTVAENIFVIRENFGGYVLNRKRLNTQADALFKDLGIDMTVDKQVYQLSHFEKTTVELVKAYALGKKIVLLEDLSSFLSDDDLEKAVKIIVKLKALGVSFIMIESFTEILKQFSDRLCILKGGKIIWTLKKEEIEESLFERYFYTTKHELTDRNTKTIPSDIISFEGLESSAFYPISFKIKQGELITLLDSEGSAIESLANIITGNEPLTHGLIKIGDKPFKASHGLRQGIAFMPEMPTDKLLFSNLKAIDNLCFASEQKTKHFWLKNRFRNSCLEEYGKFFEGDELLMYTDELSVYTKQKLAYLKWHLYHPKLVVCMRPFSSIDVELRETTAKHIQLLLDRGISILALTSNLSELNQSGTKIVITSK